MGPISSKMYFLIRERTWRGSRFSCVWSHFVWVLFVYVYCTGSNHARHIKSTDSEWASVNKLCDSVCVRARTLKPSAIIHIFTHIIVGKNDDHFITHVWCMCIGRLCARFVFFSDIIIILPLLFLSSSCAVLPFCRSLLQKEKKFK